MMIADKLFSLLRSALWGDTFLERLSVGEFEQVLKLAKEQTVTGASTF